MHKIGILLLVLLSAAIHSASGQEKLPSKGLVVQRSVKFKKGTYAIDGWEGMKKAVIEIRGENITVDFNGAVLQGSAQKKSPDEAFGMAVHVKGGKNITIRNLTAKGYKVALLATGVQGLKLENCDLSYNYRPRLHPTTGRKDTTGAIRAQAGKDQALPQGAGLLLQDCSGLQVRDCKVAGGQHALLLYGCTGGTVYNNNFSFNSGIGLFMDGCSNLQVLYNRIQFNVRGYSQGAGKGQQGSGGIVTAGASHHNLFYKNAVTHNTSGLYMEPGAGPAGGTDHNIVMDNDFSFAPHAGIKAAGRGNRMIHNRIFECDFGILGSNSLESSFSDNQFRSNRIGMALENSRRDTIHTNLFFQDSEAIRLWNRPRASADGGPDVDGAGVPLLIANNSFNKNRVVFHLSGPHTLRIFGNLYSLCDSLYRMDTALTRVDTTADHDILYALSAEYQPTLDAVTAPNDPFKGNGRWAGRKNIIMTDWGPYDFAYPYIWQDQTAGRGDTVQLRLGGPKGKWKILSLKGGKLLALSGDELPARIAIEKSGGAVEVVAAYSGAAFTGPFGEKIPAGKPYRFVFKEGRTQ